MLLDYTYVNLCTEFRAVGKYVKENYDQRACFGSVSHPMREDKEIFNQDYYIKIYHTPDMLKMNNKNHYCFINPKEYLDLLCDFFKVKYDLTKEEDHYVLHLEVHNKTAGINRILFTYIRPLYEYPFSFALHDAMELYKSGDCPKMNIVDCYNLVLGVSDLPIFSDHTLIQYHDFYKPMSYKELWNRTKECCWTSRMLISAGSITTPEQVKCGPKRQILENFINTYYRRHDKYVMFYRRFENYYG